MYRVEKLIFIIIYLLKAIKGFVMLSYVRDCSVYIIWLALFKPL